MAVNKGDVANGTIGFPFKVEPVDQDGVTVDITGSTNVRCKLVAPSGEVKSFTTGVSIITEDAIKKFQYVTQAATDLDEDGPWYIQFEYDRSTLTDANTEPVKFKVYTDYEPET